ncbi:ribosome small subunit-dependent GTPase A [Lactobacillus sp. LC28-10]|uniref:Small ribosomal subunit biogenesis GTPase RsgA n=1 Tax=Secundilactobacillus angelensis TaxID=2722706 RepID=A0ABX1L1K7_9LACO|nr:ribosome small subunit-dependent GTPase A [Secundilactobacillus angelensis]MCH5462748.1 ribosome small subunit-dependent GTPase A [Secundilactobacillus angelensis]NLR19098.1 ribosome small subunit-dependent GTPase A [Secundilactobacillus angelensis]
MEDKTIKLTEYGASEAQKPTSGLSLARVIATSHQQYTIVTEQGQFTAQVAGRLINFANGPEDFPTVGDWVEVRLPNNSADAATIERLNDRTTVFLRKAAGRRSAAQLVAANVDWLLLCMALDANFNVRRLERYLAIAAASGARSAIVLTKADKTSQLAEQLSTVAEVSGGADVIVCDATNENGMAELTAFMQPRLTYAFLGSSGVGKTTLINHLLGKQSLATAAVRATDDHGRHTTTARQLVKLPNGSLVIDTPGMRELGLLEANLDSTFSDITELAKKCRFNDCTHQQEPGCAVQQAVADGQLSEARLASYRQLQDEQANNQLRGKERENAKIERMFGGKKQMKAFLKEVRRKRK